MKNDLYKTIEKCSSVQCIDSQMHVFCYPIYQVLRTKINSSLANANIAIDSSILSDLIFQSHNHIIDTVLYKVLEYEYQIAIKYEFISASEKQVIFLESAEMEAISNDLEWWFYILNKYKALGPMISKKIDNISAYICFVISKYITDSTALEEMCKCKLKLYSIKLFKGDLHHNRCVTAFLFNEGETICYLKPRNAENESFLIEFIDIINSLGANIVLGIPQFIDYREYSWHLNVNKSQMKNNQSIDSYYYNLGKILCVFYIMHSQDIIPDNIISHQGVPYIIDYECIFAKYSTSKYDIIQTEYMNSVMSTGILPTWMLSDMQSRNRISSVLFPFGENSSHLPIKNGEAKSINVKLLAYFIDGFKTLYSLMEHNSQYILGRLESAIKLHKNINSRIILHPTSLYVLLLNEAIIPETLANDKQLNKLAQKLALDSLPKELNRNIVNSILKSIKEGSVPAFYIKSAEIGIFDSFDNNLGNYYHYSIEDGIENLRTRMKKLSALDLRLQTAIIEDSVRAFMHTMYPLKNRTININKCVFDRLKLLVAAKSIADKIKERIFSINNTVGLVCKTRSSIDGRYQALPLSSNIYDGDCGVLIFFEMLYKYTGDLSYKHISEGIFCRVKSYTEYSINLSEYRNINLSPMTGIMGIIYVMELFPERYYEYKTYNAVIKYVTDNLRFARSYDFLTGIIGIMSFVINASFIEQSDKIRLINRCVKILNKTKHSKTDGSIYWEYIDRLNHLSNNALELGGFAHGSASAAAVLYQAYVLTKSTTALKLSKGALIHDRSFFSYKINGWVDGRNMNSVYDGGSWCHGAAGIALSRLLLLDQHFNNKSMLITELEIAYPQMAKVIGGNICLCHGMGGNLELMQATTLYTKDNMAKSNIKKWIYTLADKAIKKQPLICGDDSDREIYGLFMGLSGFGYQFLRFYDWAKVPSLLFLETKPDVATFHINAEAEKHVE